jgi:hypothetical protein
VRDERGLVDKIVLDAAEVDAELRAVGEHARGVLDMVGGPAAAEEAAGVATCPGRFHCILNLVITNRRDIGTSQSKWTDAKMQTPGFSHGESKRLVIEAPWLVNGGHGASLRRH